MYPFPHDRNTEHIACSINNRNLFEQIEVEFNRIELEATDREPLLLRFHFHPNEDVIRGALSRDFGIICPDSVFSLDEIEAQWKERYGNQNSSVFKEQFTFASSPIVFFLSQRAVEKLNCLEQIIGWQFLLEVASSNSEFGLMHAEGLSNDGQPIILGQFAALSTSPNYHNDDPNHITLQKVRTLQQKIQEYGPSDYDTLMRAFRDNEWRTDLVIAQERYILEKVINTPSITGVIVYPREGSIWVNQSVSLMNCWERPKTSEVFQKLKAYLLSTNSDNLYSKNFLHSTKGNLGSKSEVKEFYKIQPPTIKQQITTINYGSSPMVLPGHRVVRSITEIWGNVEKPADVCLLIDISGSMDKFEKIGLLKSGLSEFLDRFRSPHSTVTIIEFESSAKVLAPLQLAIHNKAALQRVISQLQPKGQTALLDAVNLAVQELNRLGNPSHLQVIIALTDGQENNSNNSLLQIQSLLYNHRGVRFYGIAYGQDADSSILEQLANVTGGMVCSGEISDIEKIYKQLSQYI
jgi:Ca-activated chloride channel homolog